MTWVLLAAGIIMLYLGAEWLVGGASGLALSLRVPKLIVGLTVVAYGTSAPEVVVGIDAAMAGHGDVALGNVLGSNIVNLGLILGLSVLVRPAQVHGALRRYELPVLLGATAALPAVLHDGRVAAWEAGALLAGAVAYTGLAVLRARTAMVVDAFERAEATAGAADLAGAPSVRGRARLMVTTLVGLGVLLVGGRVFVSAATDLARELGMSDRVVGLTVVAIGTSLPELATTLIAAARGHSDIAVGNVVGSNIFNALLCLGVSGLVGDLAIRPSLVIVELGVLVAMTLLAAFFVRAERTMPRWEGALLLAAYLAFLAYLATR
jgi:cation:H+ antiporter